MPHKCGSRNLFGGSQDFDNNIRLFQACRRKSITVIVWITLQVSGFHVFLASTLRGLNSIQWWQSTSCQSLIIDEHLFDIVACFFSCFQCKLHTIYYPLNKTIKGADWKKKLNRKHKFGVYIHFTEEDIIWWVSHIWSLQTHSSFIC